MVRQSAIKIEAANQKLVNVVQNTNSEVENNFGVLCLSEVNNNTLMWGHYADSHAGICIGYDFEKLIRYLRNNAMSKVFNYKVDYVEEVPRLDFLRMEDNDYLLEAITRRFSTKYIDWKYEQELRVIISNYAKRVVVVPTEILVELVFGYKTPQSDIKTIKNLCNELYPHVNIFKSTTNRKFFQMDIVEL